MPPISEFNPKSNCNAFHYCVYSVSILPLIFILLFNRCAGAGHIRDDILHYRKELEKCSDADKEKRAYLMDMGIKPLRSVKLQGSTQTVK